MMMLMLLLLLMMMMMRTLKKVIDNDDRKGVWAMRTALIADDFDTRDHDHDGDEHTDGYENDHGILWSHPDTEQHVKIYVYMLEGSSSIYPIFFKQYILQYIQVFTTWTEGAEGPQFVHEFGRMLPSIVHILCYTLAWTPHIFSHVGVYYPHLVHFGESCPRKISRLIFGVLTFLRLKSWCLTFLAGIYRLRRIKFAGTNFLMPKVSRKEFLPLCY